MSNGLGPDLDGSLSILIWVQNVSKGYQLTTKVTARKNGVKIENSTGPDEMLLSAYTVYPIAGMFGKNGLTWGLRERELSSQV